MFKREISATGAMCTQSDADVVVACCVVVTVLWWCWGRVAAAGCVAGSLSGYLGG